MQLHDNRLSTLRSYMLKQLAKAGYDDLEQLPTYKWLMHDLLSLSSSQLLLADDTRLSESEILKSLAAIKQLKLGIPIQYVVGRAEFYGRDFISDSRALIPRPETEELVAWILEEASSPCRAIDIGTGTGCIAISLAAELPTGSKVSALDFSREALALCKENAKLLKQDITLYHDDILKPRDEYGSYDIIVSNPPYVKEQERSQMHSRVLDYEPDMALFVSDADPLVFYRAIAVFAQKHLSKQGLLYFEINEALGHDTLQLLSEMGYQDCELRADINGKDRMIRCRWERNSS